MTERKLFGTDGVRGVANVYPMTAETAMQLGRALAHSIRRGSHRHRVVIGKDTRLSGYMLEQSLAAGICSMGVDVVLVGPLPTPGISFITKSQRADAGAVISASHNPYQDNGIKFFSRDGFKLPDETEAELEGLIFNNAIDHLRPTATKIGKAFRLDDAAGRYVEYLKNSFPSDLTLDGLTLVVDCANGAGYRVGPAVFEELGARVVRLGVKPDGKNINARCGALFPEQLCRAVLKEKAHLGIALDGDADRVIVSDERGQVVDGEAVMAVCARDMARRGTLKNNLMVTTVMSSLGLDMSLTVARRPGRPHPGRRSLRRRGNAPFGGQLWRRAERPSGLSRPCHDRRRNPGGPEAAVDHGRRAEAALQLDLDVHARSAAARECPGQGASRSLDLAFGAGSHRRRRAGACSRWSRPGALLGNRGQGPDPGRGSQRAAQRDAG